MGKKVNSEEKRIKKALHRRLQKLQKREEKSLQKKKKHFTGVENIKDKVRQRVPEKLTVTLTAAFFKGFELIFEKGTAAIEKTYDKEELTAVYHMYQEMSRTSKNPEKVLKEMEKRMKKSHTAGKGMAAAEGTVLGLLGIGLPDIPLFIGGLLKGIYETALHYGFTYESREEKVYILNLICGALAEGEEKKKYSVYLDVMGDGLDLAGYLSQIHFQREGTEGGETLQKDRQEAKSQGNTPGRETKEGDLRLEYDYTDMSSKDWEEMQKEAAGRAADLLSHTMLTSKFVQGIPLVGAVGSVVNFNVYGRIMNFAGMKYQKRFLRREITQKKP